jgi:hypothetical protein
MNHTLHSLAFTLKGMRSPIAATAMCGNAPLQTLSVTPEVGRPTQKAVIRFEAYLLQYLTAEQNFNQVVRNADRGYVILHLQITFEGTNELYNNEWYGSFCLAGRPSPSLQSRRGALAGQAQYHDARHRL